MGAGPCGLLLFGGRHLATIRPFAAYRPAEGLEKTIAALPYDVFTRKEARAYVAAHPDSFLAIDRPETQFPEEVSTYDDRVYDRARDMLEEKIRDGVFVQDEKPCFYLYEETWQGRTQTGIVACASVDEYKKGIVRRNENTIEEKEEDRTRHVETTGFQTGPIFLTYRRNDTLERIVFDKRQQTPVCDFVSDTGIQNRIWVIDDPETIGAIEKAFAEVKRIYIADGHHRAASAVKAADKLRAENPDCTGDEPYNWFLSVLFPDTELVIMDYNRVVTDLNGFDKSEILTKIKGIFQVTPYRKQPAKPQAKGEIGMYLGHSWYLLTVRNNEKHGGPVGSLDVSILQRKVLDPIFGIRDPRTDERIRFVGGTEGLEALAALADRTGGAAFAMYPTSMAELFAVSDAGLLMPPKSTLFEPKLLSGLFLHRIR